MSQNGASACNLFQFHQPSRHAACFIFRSLHSEIGGAMSSMFKKKGGLAFKPRIPSTRSRTIPPATVIQSTRTTEQEPPTSSTTESIAQDQPDVSNNIDSNEEVSQSESRPSRSGPRKPVQKVAPKPEKQSDKRSTASTRQQEAEVDGSGTQDQAPRAAESQDAATSVRQSTPNARSSRRIAARSDPVATASGPVGTSATTQVSSLPVHQAIESEAISSVPQTQQSSAPSASTLDTAPIATSDLTIKPRGKKRANRADNNDENKDEGRAATPIKRRKSSAQNGDLSGQSDPKKSRSESQSEADGQPRKSRARSLTPENAESQVVDLQRLTMADLTKDLHIGKKFSRHDELRDRERQARLKARLGKSGSATEDEPRRSESRDAEREPSTQAASSENATKPPQQALASGPQFRIVDGQIVVDQNSLVMDRHARAAAAQNGQDMETIEENDFTRLITSSSFLNSSKLKGPNIWNNEETELFYYGLRMFGTDFEIISKMFPGKHRRHVKLKFNREERHNPQRIDDTVIGKKTTAINIEEYKAATGTEFESVETIELEQRQIQEGYEAERQRIVDEQAEIMRKKREELFADEGNEEATGKKRKGAKKKGRQVAYGLNGKPISTET